MSSLDSNKLSVLDDFVKQFLLRVLFIGRVLDASRTRLERVFDSHVTVLQQFCNIIQALQDAKYLDFRDGRGILVRSW